jgi:hypothetical protein
MRALSIRILFVCGVLVAHTGRMQTVAIAQSPTESCRRRWRYARARVFRVREKQLQGYAG